jgi:glycosyltransferase involved in cell wall biosynthesis
VRLYCVHRGLKFTTSYHTRSPEYLWEMLRLPARLTHGYLRWFHRPAAATMVATPSIEQALRQHGYTGRLVRWSRGVDLKLFHPRPRSLGAAELPVLLYVGRVSVEKNLEAFLGLSIAGTKYVVGDGPARAMLQQKYPVVRFLGELRGEELACAYASADVFVFPSKTDTFGLVILEALASGVPVAAYPAPGPVDILTRPEVGALDEDLGKAIATALHRGNAQECVTLAREYTWEKCAHQFHDNLVWARPPAAAKPGGLLRGRRTTPALTAATP